MKLKSKLATNTRLSTKNPAQSKPKIATRAGSVAKTPSKPKTKVKIQVKAGAGSKTAGPVATARQIRIGLKPEPVSRSRTGAGGAKVAVQAPGRGSHSTSGHGQQVSPAMVRAVTQALQAIESSRAQAAVNGGPHYDTDARYDSGIRYAADDPVPTPVQTGTGAKVKLELNVRNNANVIDFARTHDLAITGNPNFPTPLPAPTVFQAKLAELEAVNAEYEQMRLALKSLNERRNRVRGEFDAIFNQRATYVELQSGGSAELIQEVALPVKNPSIRLPQLVPPIGLRTDLNGTPGVMKVRWETVTGARAYLMESSLVLPDAPREWQLTKVGGSNAMLSGLTVGARYAFRVAAVGGADGRSQWSPVVERVAG